MKKVIILLIVLLLFCSAFFTKTAIPFPNHTEYSKGCIKPSLYSQEELDEQVMRYYDRWKERYITDVPQSDIPMKYVNFCFLPLEWLDQTIATVSEAHGYGMIILATMSGYDEKAREDFDAMFNYFKAFPSRGDKRLMSWKQLKVRDEQGNIIGVEDIDTGSSVSDGDLDIAYALLMADNQWGSYGEINYREEAQKLLDGIVEAEVHPEYNYLLLGDWSIIYDSQMEGTRPSDFLINHMTILTEADEKNSETWNKMRNETLKICDQIFKRNTPNCGILPDFVIRNEKGEYIPAPEFYLEAEFDGDYNWNSCRVPWRLPMDYIISGKIELYKQIQTMNEWIKKETEMNPLSINPGYYIINGETGKQIIRDWEVTDMSYIAPFAVSAMVDENNQEWLDNLWSCIISDEWENGIPFEENPYYPNTLRMLMMIVVSGNWWAPK